MMPEKLWCEAIRYRYVLNYWRSYSHKKKSKTSDVGGLVLGKRVWDHVARGKGAPTPILLPFMAGFISGDFNILLICGGVREMKKVLYMRTYRDGWKEDYCWFDDKCS